MHSVVDWLAFAKWKNGELVRSLSLSPDSGILEDIGLRLPFEEPFWSSKHQLPRMMMLITLFRSILLSLGKLH